MNTTGYYVDQGNGRGRGDKLDAKMITCVCSHRIGAEVFGADEVPTGPSPCAPYIPAPTTNLAWLTIGRESIWLYARH